MFTYFGEKNYDIICLQETCISKDVCDGWDKKSRLGNDFTSHSSGQVILFRNGVINNVNIVYSFRRIRINRI